MVDWEKNRWGLMTCNPSIKEAHRADLRKIITKAGGCDIQHDGGTCGTCFFDILEELGVTDDQAQKYWEDVLAFRGDYSHPEDSEKSWFMEMDEKRWDSIRSLVGLLKGGISPPETDLDLEGVCRYEI